MQKVLLKDQLFNEGKIKIMAEQIEAVHGGFKSKLFVKEVVEQFEYLELKQRVTHVAECLNRHLTEDYESSVSILIKSLPKENNEEILDGEFGDFIYASYSEYVVNYGAKKKHLQTSLQALEDITKRFSSEYAIRDFINEFEEDVLSKLLSWSKDNNHYVRRLSSEGSRPKLPWGKKINLDIKDGIKILDNLYFDKSRFVTRSVANHINDISKINPELAVDTLKRWQKENQKNKIQSEKEMDYIINHSLRTLVKNGNKEAFELLNVSHKTPIILSDFQMKKSINMDDDLEFSFVLRIENPKSSTKKENNKKENIVVDYVIYFAGKNGEIKNKKIYKIKKLKLANQEELRINKKHRMRSDMTTRKIYKGKYKVEILVNAKVLASQNFEIV
ncbi:MAG: hypothetical protein QG614_455 [Patescibacteria group bacterium]|nr:hypothetical protein [Patescibacteria group bacterium]